MIVIFKKRLKRINKICINIILYLSFINIRIVMINCFIFRRFYI
uniref:Uncharacterized protein n=1 Tax=Iridovirus sp. TaxID=135728 RepID=A0AAU7YBE7_9VIRU